VRGVAADVRAGEAQVLAQQVDQQQPRFDLEVLSNSVTVMWMSCLAMVIGLPPARRPSSAPRPASTRAISRLYSTEPRRSAVGDAASAARRAASAMLSSVALRPFKNSSAAVERSGIGPAFVSASPTCVNPPLPSSVTCAAAAAVA